MLPLNKAESCVDGICVDGRPFHQVREENIPCCTKRFPLRLVFKLNSKTPGREINFKTDLSSSSTPIDLEYSYALGVRAGSYRHYRKYVHTGSFGGFNSYVFWLPQVPTDADRYTGASDEYGFIAVYVNVNGGYDTYSAMRKIIYYAVDLLTNQKEGFSSLSNHLLNEMETNDVRLPHQLNLKNPPAQDCHQVVNLDGYNPAGLESHFDQLAGSYHHNLIGQITISKVTNRRSCSTSEIYETLRIEIGKFGTGWIENWFFHQNSKSFSRFGFPTSIKDDEDISCCEGHGSLVSNLSYKPHRSVLV